MSEDGGQLVFVPVLGSLRADGHRTSCPGVTQSQYCPAYYLYRDGQGNWQVA
jgi:hypothetical protein